MSIREGFNEIWKTFKTGKGYERRLRESRRAYEEHKYGDRMRRHAENRERRKKEENEKLMEKKRKDLQVKIKQDLMRKEDKRKQKKEEKKSYKKEEGKLTKTISPKGGKIDDMSFGEAFKSSRSSGKKEFTWRGNKYHTRTKEEEQLDFAKKRLKYNKGIEDKGLKPKSEGPHNKYEEGGEVQRHQAPSFSSMFDVGSKMKLKFGGGAASERAKMRHERKMARQGARADRKMVRTEGRQERRADRLAGRQETSSRRQDRKDQRQDSRLGYYEKGGKTPRIKKKDRPKGAELDELMYKQQYGVDYADDPNMDRELPTGVLSEIQSTPKKYNTQETKTKAGQFISKIVGAKEHGERKKRRDSRRMYKGKPPKAKDRTQAYREKTRKKKNILGKTIIYGDTLFQQDKRSADDKGGSVHTRGPGSRTKSYDVVNKDGNKERVYFKTQEEADRYFANIDKDTGQAKVLGEKQDFEKTTPYTVLDSEGREKKKEVKGTVEAHGSTELGDIEDEDKRDATEVEIRQSKRNAPKTGITSKHSALDFSDQSPTNLRNPSKYSDKKTKYVFDPAKGTVFEKVKRRSGIGYKKTGREKDIEGYQELADEKRQQRESEESKKPTRKERRQQNKSDKKQRKEEKSKQAEVARKAREEGKSSYEYNGTTYKITPKVMKGGGTLMEQYNRKFQEGGVNMDEDQDGLPIGVDATPGGTMQGPTMPPNNNQMSISGNNLGEIKDPLANDEPEPDNLFEEDVNIDNTSQTQDQTNQGDMNQQDDSMDQGGMDQGQEPAGPTRAQLRHERKMARQQARADRRMVRTEAKQQRKADRLAGRMEKRGRRQDRKDQRQEARISKREDRRAERQSRKFDRQQNRNMRRRNRRGNFHEGGMVKGKKGAGLGIIIMVGRKGNKKRK